MSPATDAESTGTVRTRPVRWVRRVLIAAAAAAAVLVLVVSLVVFLIASAGRVPSFPSLADAPDPSLRGTVAWGDYLNLRLVSLSGATTRNVLTDLREQGLPLLEEVTWLPDGRLQATAYGLYVNESPTPVPWRVIVDPVSGSVEEVPAGAIPSEPTPAVDVVSPDGERIVLTVDDGHVEIALSGPEGTRTLMEADGGSQYAIDTPTWCPSWDCVLVHDTADRILLVTTGDQPTTRILVAEDAALLWGGVSTELLTTG